MTALGSITTSSLRAQAAKAIRTAIITGEIKPGDIYSVPALAARLGVSATPVREAMLDLVSEGLIVPIRNRGYRVVSLRLKDLDDILDLRLLLEPPSMGRVAVTHRQDDIPRFMALARELPRLARAGEFQAYLDTDREFHLGLLGLLNNRRLVEIVEKLRNQTRLLDVGALAAAGGLVESGIEHVDIIDAIAGRNRERTEHLVTGHLARLRQSCLTESSETAATRASLGGPLAPQS